MTPTDLKALFLELIEDDMVFGYTGAFSDSITEKLIGISEHNIDNRGNLVKLKRKINFLMAECYQNIVRHGEDPYESIDNPAKSSAFFARSKNKIFYITSANYVLKETADTMGSKLDSVNELSPDDLKLLYMETLDKGELSAKGGAGLGLIEMARKSGNKLDYLFERVDDEMSMFYLHLKLKAKDLETEGSATDEIQIGEMKTMHENLYEENILMMHKGDFSKESVLPLIQMIENNLKEQADSSFDIQRMYHISVEILQNISLHALKTGDVSQGIFILGKQDNSYTISTVNYIKPGEAALLEKKIAELMPLSKEELNKMYKTVLRSGPDKEGPGAGLGLIDVFRLCKTFNYEISKEGDNTYYSQVITI